MDARALALLLSSALAAPASPQVVKQTLEGLDHQDGFGVAVAGGRDTNGDGRPDFVIGAPSMNDDDTWYGRVFVVSGADGSVLHVLKGTDPPFPTLFGHDAFGASVAMTGDVDGDGCAEVIVGAPSDDFHEDRAGAVWLISGRTGATIHVYRPVTDEYSEFGITVAAAGDVDGDGVPDVLGGAWYHTWHGHVRAGSAWVLSGATGGLIRAHYGALDYDQLGLGLTGLGDLNGDGRAEYAIGAPQTPAFYPYSDDLPGYVRVHDGATGAVRLQFIGGSLGDGLGGAIASAGDVDGDGLPDLIAGSPRYLNEYSIGTALIWSGATGALIHSVHDDHLVSGFGAAVGTAGDLDGDGRSEFLVGAPDHHSLGTAPGTLRIYRGADGTLLHAFTSDTDGEFGSALAAGGDLDGDGHRDWVVGEPWAKVGASSTAAGKVWVVSIEPPAPSAVAPPLVPAAVDGQLTITGTGLALADKVRVGLAIIPESAFISQTNEKLVVPTPLAASLGSTALHVGNLVGYGAPVLLDVVPVAEPVLLAPALASSTTPYVWGWGGPPGATAWLLVSLAGGATTTIGGHPVLSAGLLLTSAPTSPAGTGSFAIAVPAAAVGLFFHSQVVFTSGSVIGSSNVLFSFVGA